MLAPDLTFHELTRISGDYRERNERDLLAQRRMAEFAESKGCRWAALFDYFGRATDPERPDGPCGHCDRCP